jgi:large subunit ribosomal protein L15
MMQHEITELAGAHKGRRRIGRGESSGYGKTSGRGHKGYKARSGGGPHRVHEGGQMPMFRRLPKRGFSNFNFERRNDIVTLRDLNRVFADGETVDLAALGKAHLIAGDGAPVKVLATGVLEKKLTVEAHACSPQARAAIEKAGGSIKLIDVPSPAAKAKAKRGSAKGKRPERSSRLEKKLAKAAAAKA